MAVGSQVHRSSLRAVTNLLQLGLSVCGISFWVSILVGILNKHSMLVPSAHARLSNRRAALSTGFRLGLAEARLQQEHASKGKAQRSYNLLMNIM